MKDHRFYALQIQFFGDALGGADDEHDGKTAEIRGQPKLPLFYLLLGDCLD
jgi:hypothetical protein